MSPYATLLEPGAPVALDGRAEHAERRELERFLERERAFAEVVLDDRRILLAHPGADGVAHHLLLFRVLALDVEQVGLERRRHDFAPRARTSKLSTRARASVDRLSPLHVRQSVRQAPARAPVLVRAPLGVRRRGRPRSRPGPGRRRRRALRRARADHRAGVLQLEEPDPRAPRGALVRGTRHARADPREGGSRDRAPQGSPRPGRGDQRVPRRPLRGRRPARVRRGQDRRSPRHPGHLARHRPVRDRHRGPARREARPRRA